MRTFSVLKSTSGVVLKVAVQRLDVDRQFSTHSGLSDYVI
jgi:hypothetical protein